jgi:Rieske Fe-S protein
MHQEPEVRRRSFLNVFLGTTLTAFAGAVIYPVLRFLSPPEVPEAAGSRVLAAKRPEMAERGWKIFPFGQEPGILVEVNPGEYRAFTATCTHLDCTVQFDGETRRIWCPCHNGWYDLEGRNVAGPPPKPLTPFVVQVVDDDIFVLRG